MVFSNNMEYDDSSPEQVEGAFYATTAQKEPTFIYFREEPDSALPALHELHPSTEAEILCDNNLQSIQHTVEFATNKDPNSPTNRICTSLFCRERLAFLLRYGFAYVRAEHGLKKHIMRYPQLFATKAIEAHLEADKRSGIIWHTQGSGKTALAYYNVKHLKDYYTKRKSFLSSTQSTASICSFRPPANSVAVA